MITPVFAKATQPLRIAIMISLFVVGLRTKMIQALLVLGSRGLPLSFWLRLGLRSRALRRRRRSGLFKGRLRFRLLSTFHQSIVGGIEVKLPQGLRVPFPHRSDLKLKGLPLFELGFDYTLSLLSVSVHSPYGFHLILLYEFGVLTREAVPKSCHAFSEPFGPIACLLLRPRPLTEV